ncbi:TonB-dependent receptor [soil metagenome]
MLLKRKILFGTTVIAGVIAASAPAFAQTAPTPTQEESSTVDEVVVTGSRIRRDPTTAPTPLIQVGRADLQNTGLATVIDYLATIPALSNSQVPSDTVGNVLNATGLSLPNLRSLGAGRTLTLVDGRRHVGSSFGNLAVDIDTIPRLLIENIEIVTGGASSVYGADAVSGVLNFVLRKDYDGFEIDATGRQLNQDGPEGGRVSALIGKNFFDDRLNVYAFAEYEKNPEITSLDIDWIRRANVLIGTDADPTASPIDGDLDARLFSGVVRLDNPRWGSLTLANNQQPSALNDPDVAQPSTTCTGISVITLVACYSVDPAKTFWFDGTTGRLANFGTRIGNTGANRPFNIGGDGENPANFTFGSRTPDSEAQRYQVGTNVKITENIHGSLEAKYIVEDSAQTGQPTFFDVFLSDSRLNTQTNRLRATSQFDLRITDNAYLPANVKAAILANTITNYANPTANSPGVATSVVAAPFARHEMFGPDRYQENHRELQRYVVDLQGDYDQVLFVKNLSWDVGYTYGKTTNQNDEYTVESQRFALAADAVVDSTGIVNGRPGEVVCRVQLLAKQNPALATGSASTTGLYDYVRGGDLRSSATGLADINQCQPLNIFGKGNQSDAALAYVKDKTFVTQENQQEDALASVTGQLWDFWGAGAIGVSIGAEYRKETAVATGRSAGVGDRFVFGNGSTDFPERSYDTKEYFAEVSVPLFRNSFLGDYAELSGSYRKSDYSTVGEQEVYGFNLVYRPIKDIAFKTSYNTSIRVPTLGENFSAASQTFVSFTGADPCSTAVINAAGLAADIRANRIANCTTLASRQGLTFDFAGATAQTSDDFAPVYSSTVAGVNSGNPFLTPEESDSFTFSVVLQPRFIPNFSLVLDYYEIEIDNVISAVGALAAATNCVSGPSLNDAACNTIFRNDPLPGRTFYVGAAATDPIGGFIQGSVNYAQRTTRGLDFTATYRLDTAETFGHDWGQLRYRIAGSWLIEQQTFENIADPTAYTESASTVFFPRVRFTSQLTWEPTDRLTLNWVADFQTSQNIIFPRNFIANLDSRPLEYISTGNFVRNDFTAQYQVNDELQLRAGVTNAFDAEQAPWLGVTLDSNFDPYGRRFSIGLNYKVW